MTESGGNQEFVELPDGRKKYFRDLRSDTGENVMYDIIGVLEETWCEKLQNTVQINMSPIFDDSQFREIGFGLYLGIIDFMDIFFGTTGV